MNLRFPILASERERRVCVSQYDKYPVRNSNGYIEYLTAEQIENLRDAGEAIQQLDRRAARKLPPVAQNPQNQAHVNELFYQQQRQGRGRRNGVGRVAGGIASAGFIAGALGGATAHPQQNSDTTRQHYGQASLNEERGRRGSQARDATRDKGSQDRGSSEQ